MTEHGLIDTVYTQLKFIFLTRETEYVPQITFSHTSAAQLVYVNYGKKYLPKLCILIFFLVHQYVTPYCLLHLFCRKCRKEDYEFLNGIIHVSFNAEAEYNRKADKLLMKQLDLLVVLKKILNEY